MPTLSTPSAKSAGILEISDHDTPSFTLAITVGSVSEEISVGLPVTSAQDTPHL